MISNKDINFSEDASTSDNDKFEKLQRCKKCNLCNFFILDSPNFKSSITHKCFRFSNFEPELPVCQYTNLIYLISCQKCSLQYVGLTTQKFQDRFNAHKNSIERNSLNTILCNHFNSNGHNISDLRIQIIDHIINDNNFTKNDINHELHDKEDYWMRILNSISPFGLNDNVKSVGNMRCIDLETLNAKDTPFFSKKTQRAPRSHGRRPPKSKRKYFSIDIDATLANLYSTFKDNDMHKLYTSLRALPLVFFRKTLSYANNFPTNFISLLSAYTSQFKTTINNKKEQNDDRLYMVTKFINKGIEYLNLPKILHSKVFRDLIPSGCKFKEPPIVTYKYLKTIGQSIFNYRQTLSNITIEEILNPQPCTCKSEKSYASYVYEHTGHVITGNLDIIDNIPLRNLMKKGANFREQQPISFKNTFKSLCNDLDNFIKKWSKKEKIPEIHFENWSNELLKYVKHTLKNICDQEKTNKKIVLQDPEVIKCLKALQEKFVIVPVDKAANNFAFICKNFYINRMNKELGITNSNIIGNDVYIPCKDKLKNVIDRQSKDLKDFHINVQKDQLKLPLLYFNSKQHKNPFKERFIAGASKCTTKTLSIEVSLILKELKSHFKNYCNKIFERNGIKYFWSIENSNEFLTKLNNMKKATSIHTFDFSTLYTNLPLKSLQKSLQQFILHMFKISDKKFIFVNSGKKKAFWSNDDEYSKNHKMYTSDFLINAVNYLLENTFVTYGPLLFRQTKGIPMGGNSSQDFADIHLIWKEFIYMKKLVTSKNFELAKKLSNNSRYIDDIATLNLENFLSIALEIYDKELTLEPSQNNGLEDDFLDINVKIINNQFITKIYHKVDKFNFEVVSFPFPDSNINSKIIANTFYSQLIRYMNICSYSSDFSSRLTLIYQKLCSRGYPEKSLQETFKKFIIKNPFILEKYRFNNPSECFEFCLNQQKIAKEETLSITQCTSVSKPNQLPGPNTSIVPVIVYNPPKLPNLGNTCYLNAILQIFVLCNHYVDIIPLLNTSVTDYENILLNIKSLLSYTTSSLDKNQISNLCKNIKSNLAKFEPLIFNNETQQDSHEAFLKICNILDNATKTILFTGSQPDNLGLFYDSIIKKLFFGILENSEICNTCGHQSKKPDTFYNINVVPALDISKDLTSEWKQIISQKICNNCNNNTRHFRTTSIQMKPNILVILFNRFKTLQRGRISKLNTQINLSDELKIPGFTGQLIGCIDHFGSTPYSGHYVSNIKINNSWFLCNDETITPTSSPNNSQSVYLAFYKELI